MVQVSWIWEARASLDRVEWLKKVGNERHFVNKSIAFSFILDDKEAGRFFVKEIKVFVLGKSSLFLGKGSGGVEWIKKVGHERRFNNKSMASLDSKEAGRDFLGQ